jgi:hypothetical protein
MKKVYCENCIYFINTKHGKTIRVCKLKIYSNAVAISYVKADYKNAKHNCKDYEGRV